MEHRDESWTVRLCSRWVCADLTFILPHQFSRFHFGRDKKTHFITDTKWFRNSTLKLTFSDHISGLGGGIREVSLIAIWLTEEPVEILVRWSLIIRAVVAQGDFIYTLITVCLSVCLSLSPTKVRIFCHLKDPRAHWTAECLLRKARVSMNHLWFQNLPPQRTQLWMERHALQVHYRNSAQLTLTHHSWKVSQKAYRQHIQCPHQRRSFPTPIQPSNLQVVWRLWSQQATKKCRVQWVYHQGQNIL